ncbi:MAG TPA: RsmD family RNA methyltransferase, partial [Nitrospiria bacterium]|nr:RsmD family RNA methyltransferase [Nitrospiria bacterium]
MRVIAGSAKGRRLKIRRNPDIRPTSDRVKEALFNILRNRIEGAGVLDLYSGFGGIGIEALSRGARKAVFVESDPAAVKVLEGNIAACGFSGSSVVHRMDIFRFLKTT